MKKYKLYRSLGDLDQHVRQHELVAIENGKVIFYVTDKLIHAVIYDVLRHRIILSFEAQADGLTTDDIIASLLKTVPLP